MSQPRFLIDWQVGHSPSADHTPGRFVPATVPGAVQLDWARTEGWPPFWQGEEHRRYAWMEDVHWHYRARLARPAALAADERLVLVCGGVDYACVVRVAGRIVHEQEGMFSPFEIDLTDTPDGALIEIIVAPAPKVTLPGEVPGDILDRGRKEARQSCKPAVSYGWDFHVRLIPLGIWDDTFLEVRPPSSAWLDHLEVAYTLADDLSSARLSLITTGSAPPVRWTLLDPAGAPVATTEGAPAALALDLASPALWWPHTEGPAALYTSLVETLAADGRVTQTTRQRVGLRRIRLVLAPGQIHRTGYPVTQPPEPITFEVNGRPIYVRGANWVCPEIFPGTLTPERTREQLDLFAAAHLNLVRCWGGAIVNKTAFFEQCDESGLLVWQEFPLSCNDYVGTPAYLRVLDRESRAILLRRRRHACIALWCGGNELFNSWSGMTSQAAALRLLHRNCYDLDPERPWLPTSPVVGIRHGDYRFQEGLGAAAKTVFQTYAAMDATAYVEFGVPGPPSAARLRELIPADEVWPPRPTTAWKDRHAFVAWHSGEPNSWLYPEISDDYFGPSASLEQLVERLQLLQSIGYQAIYEEARRQKPVCSAVACWVFNEPWPAAANNSLIAWPNTPKPAYHAVAAACRPTMASARLAKFLWTRGEPFTATLFLLNDAPQAIGPLHITARLERADTANAGAAESIPLGEWPCPGTSANTHATGPELRVLLPAWPEPLATLVVEVAERPEWSSRYTVALTAAVA
jgi:beta-mannosidase